MEVVSCREIALLAVLWDRLGTGDVPLGIFLVSWTVSFDAEPVSVEWILVVVVVVVPFFACQMLEEWSIVE